MPQVCIGANLLSLARDVLHVVNLGWERQLLVVALLSRLACAENDVRGKLLGVGSRVLTSLAILIAALDVLVEMAVIASLTQSARQIVPLGGELCRLRVEPLATFASPVPVALVFSYEVHLRVE